ncbi:hypothetical protein F511_04291 [Dorcoceras hygrometricum]|uniref:Isopropylmalate dehydrogenase-like domain-containing protein n=1 Tax=Dorcoceras hygrometricum TaxID=472368 RepID=A0A2Z6ZZW4_9LAMI|nr:hypothetical protein F511_04291 [Dorcoceras hygrometricum]
MKANIVTLPGDGVGPEVTAAAVAVLQAVAAHYGHEFGFDEQLIGGAAIDATGEPLPAAALAACQAADAVLLGAVGGPKWSDPNAKVRPEQGLLALRAALGVYANLRPLTVHPALTALSPLKDERLKDVDVLFVRELTGGAYFGAKTKGADYAIDECRYTEAEIERVTRRAFELARGRRRHVTSVDKANVLETSRLEGRNGLYEPIHGSAPDIAGKGIANPVGTILSTALLLRHSLQLDAEAQAVEAAVDHVLRHGPRTRDLGGQASSAEVRDAVLAALENHAGAADTFFSGARSCG